MVKLSPVDQARAIGQLEAGKSQTEVAATFGVTQGMISKLKTKFRLTGDVKDRPRSGRPKKTGTGESQHMSCREDIGTVMARIFLHKQ